MSNELAKQDAARHAAQMEYIGRGFTQGKPGEFYAQRMADLGLDITQETDAFKRNWYTYGESNTVTLRDPDNDTPNPNFTTPIFSEDKDGNIILSYWNLDGETINYWVGNKTGRNSFSDKYTQWKQVRLKEPLGDMKYKMPKGQRHFPFIPWPVVEAYRNGKKIETLYLTEGAFKAFHGARLGVAIVGLPSINLYKEKDGQLYRDIRRIVERCKVDNVVILFDADCRDISLKAIAKGEELTTRPKNFLTHVEKLRGLTRGIIFKEGRTPPNVHFMHPKRGNFKDDPKGLDDLLLAASKVSPEKLDKVLADLKDPYQKGSFFFRHDITTTTLRLATYFGLKKDDPDKFYSLHAEKIKGRNFYFFGDLYVFVNATEGVTLVTPGWAEGVVWVGNDYFWKAQVPSAKEGMSRYKLLPRKKEIIASVLNEKNFSRYLTYYTDFVNKPSHFDYQSVVELNNQKFYNRYFPFEHVPEKGECSTILDFVKHIFGTTMVLHPITQRATPRWEMGLDYIQILLKDPTQMLPVLCLYSQENSTGKSTFCKLLARIFRNNAIFVSNSDLQSDFNSVFVDKLLVMCEETLLERKTDTERIKNLSTADEITVNEKNVSQYTIDFFCKFIFCSNNRRMINVTTHDERFWIIQVPKATKENPDLLEDMTDEIPAFLQYLKDRELATKKEGRMWFYPSTIRTENFLEIVEVNEPGDVSNIRASVRDYFDASPEGTTEIMMPMKNIKAEFLTGKNSDRYVKDILKDYLGVVQDKDENGNVKSQRGSYWKSIQVASGEGGYEDRTVQVRWHGRPYVFHRATFFPEEKE